VDVIISNGMINLFGDKPAVLAKVLIGPKPGGRLAVSDIIVPTRIYSATERRNFPRMSRGVRAFANQKAHLKTQTFFVVGSSFAHAKVLAGCCL
jgi:hypothetical protein